MKLIVIIMEFVKVLFKIIIINVHANMDIMVNSVSGKMKLIIDK